MTSQDSRVDPRDSFQKAPTRWIRAVPTALDGSAAALCAQRWHGAQPVPLPVEVPAGNRRYR
jgi:hypothetical protein